MSVLDRYILRSLLVNYVIGLLVMISLYIVLDMFVNMDEFTEHGRSLLQVLGDIINYYAPNVFLYFDQLSSVIALFACMATIARMRGQNEMTALLSSGVSLYRVAVPVVCFGLATTGVAILNTEVFIPSVAHLLARNHDDLGGERAFAVLFLRDRNNALLSAAQYDPDAQVLEGLLVLTRDEAGNVVQALQADRATWEEPEVIRPVGRWKLQRSVQATRVQRDGETLAPTEETIKTHPRYYESDLSPRDIQLRQAESWVQHLSLAQLRELRKRQDTNVFAIIRTKHERMTKPIIGIVLLLLGLPFFLDRSPGSLLSDAAKCMVATGLCYVTAFLSQSITPGASSAWPFWIPIFVFGVVATVLIDRIRT
jgi:lipopolysaccharide export system permease protein